CLSLSLNLSLSLPLSLPPSLSLSLSHASLTEVHEYAQKDVVIQLGRASCALVFLSPPLLNSSLPPPLSLPPSLSLSLSQAWLTEVHEYAQKDVVIMLLGNNVSSTS